MLFHILAALFSLGAVASPEPSGSNNVPLRKRYQPNSNDEMDIASLMAHVNHTIRRHSGKSLKSYPCSPKMQKRQNRLRLGDQDADGEDTLYYGYGCVGDRCGFTFDFDTGSADTIVPGPFCGTAQGCAAGTMYDNSGTYVGNSTTVTYGSGTVTGDNYFDNVEIAGLTAYGHNVASMTTATGFAGSDSNPVLGMAFSSIAQSGQPTFFRVLIEQGAVSTQEFSFYLGREADGTGSNSGLTLGGRNPAKYTGAVTQIPVSQQNYWTIPLDGVKAGSKNSLLTGTIIDGGQAAIDTGTTLILAPTAATALIFAQIPGSFPVPLQLPNGAAQPVLYAYPCSYTAKGLPYVSLTFGGKDFVIDPRDLNFGQISPEFANIIDSQKLAALLNKGSYCLAGIMGLDVDSSDNLYIVGDAFLKNWYSIYSFNGANGQPAVSFAKAV